MNVWKNRSFALVMGLLALCFGSVEVFAAEKAPAQSLVCTDTHTFNRSKISITPTASGVQFELHGLVLFKDIHRPDIKKQVGRLGFTIPARFCKRSSKNPMLFDCNTQSATKFWIADRHELATSHLAISTEIHATETVRESRRVLKVLGWIGAKKAKPNTATRFGMHVVVSDCKLQ